MYAGSDGIHEVPRPSRRIIYSWDEVDRSSSRGIELRNQLYGNMIYPVMIVINRSFTAALGKPKTRVPSMSCHAPRLVCRSSAGAATTTRFPGTGSRPRATSPVRAMTPRSAGVTTPSACTRPDYRWREGATNAPSSTL